MDTHFHKEIEELRMKVLEMAAYTEKALIQAVQAYTERDTDLAQHVIDNDYAINSLECDIDNMSLKLLALAQPVAQDLRDVVGVMRLIVNLERIGDEAVNIAERSLILSHRPPLPYSPTMEELAKTSGAMLNNALVSFKNQDTEMAQKVCDMDSRADELDVSVIKKLIDYMLKDSPAIERSVHTILISRSLERIADLATNIAECVIFIVKGVNIKHRCSRI